MIKTLVVAVAFTFLLALLAATGPAANPQEAARLNNIGVAYMNQQLFEKALKAFEEAAAKDPALEVATVNRGVALLNLQRVDEAKALLEREAKNNPKDAHVWYNLGLYYKNSADASAAVEAFRRVTEIDPNDADTWYFLGSTYAQLKQFREAIAAFASALKLDPLHASAQFGLARAYQQSGQSDPAHEAMKKFQYITQNKLGAPISLAYGEQGKYSRAEESPLAVEKVGAAIPVRFVDVTAEAGIAPTLGAQIGGSAASFFAPGACFLDYDGDGLLVAWFECALDVEKLRRSRHGGQGCPRHVRVKRSTPRAGVDVDEPGEGTDTSRVDQRVDAAEPGIAGNRLGAQRPAAAVRRPHRDQRHGGRAGAVARVSQPRDRYPGTAAI